MGTFTYPIEITDLGERHSCEIEAIVDTGAFFTIAPPPLLRELGILRTGTRLCQMPDGDRREVEIGNAVVTIDGKSVTTIVAFGDEDGPLLLGKYTLLGLALAADPTRHGFVSLEPLPLY